jgi:long-chain fatty acid transport protein
MKLHQLRTVALASIAAFTVYAPQARAEMGAQQTSYSTATDGMGGATLANPLDALAAADNPAGMSKIGNSFTLGVSIQTIDEHNTFVSPSNEISGYKVFPILSAGVNFQLNPRVTVGVSTYGQGAGGLFNQKLVPIDNLSNAQVLFVAQHIAPSVTYKLASNFAVGAALDMVIGALQTRGVVAPNGEPIAPDLSTGFSPLPNHGMRLSYGTGIKLGALWDILPNLSLGAAYTSKVSLSRFSGYNNDLFAPTDGRVDLPEEYGVGLAWMVIPRLTLAADYLRINWASTRGFGTTFGYRNVNAGRFGVAYDLTTRWTLRGGYEVASQWSDPAFAANNTLGPAMQPRAVTAGFTYHIDKNQSISGAFEYGLRTRVEGTGTSTGSNIDTSVNYYNIAYSRSF